MRRGKGRKGRGKGRQSKDAGTGVGQAERAKRQSRVAAKTERVGKGRKGKGWQSEHNGTAREETMVGGGRTAGRQPRWRS